MKTNASFAKLVVNCWVPAFLKLPVSMGSWEEALNSLLTHLLTIVVRGVAVSWAGVSQSSEVRHHLTSCTAVNS